MWVEAAVQFMRSRRIILIPIVSLLIFERTLLPRALHLDIPFYFLRNRLRRSMCIILFLQLLLVGLTDVSWQVERRYQGKLMLLDSLMWGNHRRLRKIFAFFRYGTVILTHLNIAEHELLI